MRSSHFESRTHNEKFRMHQREDSEGRMPLFCNATFSPTLLTPRPDLATYVELAFADKRNIDAGIPLRRLHSCSELIVVWYSILLKKLTEMRISILSCASSALKSDEQPLSLIKEHSGELVSGDS